MRDNPKRKHDATGRSSLPKDNKERQRSVRSPPEGEPWVFHTLALLNSDAWKYRSVTLARLLDFLEIEHLAHGGSQNGFLAAPFNQLEKYGLTRRLISKAIVEGEMRGLIRVTRARKKGQTLHETNRFRLTYLAHRTSVDDTSWFTRPSHEWQRYVEQIPVPQSSLGQCTKVHLIGSHSPLAQSEKPANVDFEQVDEGPQLSRFLGGADVKAQPDAAPQGAGVWASPLNSNHDTFQQIGGAALKGLAALESQLPAHLRSWQPGKSTFEAASGHTLEGMGFFTDHGARQ